ncbi:predicted protein [Chaetomium globosum CBS 148.51]|uniref:Uncharacterized protein n=1 Tax=Chaetomium globosum (strain ATCC 6205 / CBS 148.51 / DSM 1962 / NBRC 6347 / NRRL 1970) TaxID=306901 RepID=Q2GYR5_CHAGB|nr:uncharacterized protein CHGG_06889 [Chaetomium globosum CBS 148.51]EAQ85636.1 predicted protein [Chaetomium globosum CBS 148.51]
MAEPARMNIKAGPHRTTAHQPQIPHTNEGGQIALWYESPRWLAIAKANPNYCDILSRNDPRRPGRPQPTAQDAGSQSLKDQ